MVMNLVLHSGKPFKILDCIMLLSFLSIPVYSCRDKNNNVDRNEQEWQKHDAIKKNRNRLDFVAKIQTEQC